ncbi:MAG TPA: hypothetical protein PKC43_04440 [Phycisphaerales bacterium]|nr:hypothetical protein [Phycisphaerales bacterium]HMP36676.1 hypothetical protein [Phycisphaerales bacterium]
MSLTRPNGNLSLRQARLICRRLGGRVEDVNCTGEERYGHPAMSRTVKVNKRRKDAPRKLITFLRQLEFLLSGHADRDRAA